MSPRPRDRQQRGSPARGWRRNCPLPAASVCKTLPGARELGSEGRRAPRPGRQAGKRRGLREGRGWRPGAGSRGAGAQRPGAAAEDAPPRQGHAPPTLTGAQQPACPSPRRVIQPAGRRFLPRWRRGPQTLLPGVAPRTAREQGGMVGKDRKNWGGGRRERPASASQSSRVRRGPGALGLEGKFREVIF